MYLSRVCPETPVKLRLCRESEQGSIISNYTSLGEDQPFEWNIVPISVYLYGVEDPRDRPLFGSFKLKHVLEERYRVKYLADYCRSQSCTMSYKAEWREMVGATMVRSVYIFAVDTTLEQDLALIAEFNALPNKNHFNGVTRNCADFTRRVINTYFPRAAHPDYLNDFGMTSPKAIARSFTHFAERHPEERLRVLHFAQLPGTIKRSSECRAGTEQLYHSKKLLVPMLIFADYGVPVVAASYLLTGRFNPEHEFEEHPAVKPAVSVDQMERTRIVGTSEEWRTYRTALDSVAEEAIREENIPGRGYLNRSFNRLDNMGTPSVDGHGALWMEIPDRGEIIRVGLSASNILAYGSDSRTAYELILSRAAQILKSPKHGRETMLEFRQDWVLLQSARAKNSISIARANRLANLRDSSGSKSGAD
ncbi:MAG TPA: hypothetical protein VH114_04445 [Candidatus Acidoferrum sp.]|nr:hypothetical protein [Candidatus Acidoferrum sp.]